MEPTPFLTALRLLAQVLLTFTGVGLAGVGPAWAQSTDTIIVVPTRAGGAYQDFVRAFEESLQKNKGEKSLSVKVIESASLTPEKFRESYSQSRLIVTVGTSAAQTIRAINPDSPVLNTLIPQSSYRAMVGNSGNGKISSIFLDQPLERRFDLVGTILPQKRTISVVLGPNTRYLQNELKSAASRKGLRIQVETVDAPQYLVGPLNRALEDADAFLAVADSVVSNRRTVQNLLLTTYRQRVPVIAYSRAYVKAGALAAVYSTPEQIGRQAGELVGGLVQSGSWFLPAPQYPKYFSVEVNHQVAQSFGIHVPDRSVIERRLRRTQGTSQ